MKKKIYFWQVAHFTYFQDKPCYWLPYSVGCLWAFARTSEKINSNYELGDFLFKRDPIKDVIETLDNPYMAVFSCYVWNYEYNRATAKAIKEKYPDCIIVFGGPQVTKWPEERKFFEKNPFVDHIVNGEGEVVFSEFLENLVDGVKPEKVIKFSRLTNVSYPSPYSGGVFDDLIAKYPDYVWQAVIETNRGCPYQCTFCDWGSATYSKIVKIDEKRVFADIDWFANNKVYYCFIADANFGILYERDKAFAERINHHQNTKGLPKVVIAQWAKNGKERILEIAKIFFNGWHNRGFTMSVQSMEDQVLEAIKRKNMETSDMEKMLKLCREKGVPAYTELILGLPYETRETWKNNHYKLLELGQHHSIDVWNTATLENSALNSPESLKEHEIKTVTLDKIVTGHQYFEGDVLEQEKIIVGTKYMPTEDLIDSYLFSSVIMHFHYLTGSTYLISRFLRQYKDVSYREIYDHLENLIQNNDDLWISQPYHRLKRFWELVVQGKLLDTEKDLKFNAHTAIWVVGTPLFVNAPKLMNDLCNIFNNDFCKLDPKMHEQLLDFQRNLVYDYNQTYPIIKKYDYDFANFVEHGSVLEKPTTVMFEYHKKWESEKHFLERAYFERRTRDNIHTRYRIIDED